MRNLKKSKNIIEIANIENLPLQVIQLDVNNDTHLIQKVECRFRSNMKNASSPPEAVAKVILQAVTSENPELRYTVGNDAEP